MANTTSNQPTLTIRDGALKATIWKNFGENGNFYSVELSRTYTDSAGEFHESNSFSGNELLRIARLAEQAYDEILSLRAIDRETTE